MGKEEEKKGHKKEREREREREKRHKKGSLGSALVSRRIGHNYATTGDNWPLTTHSLSPETFASKQTLEARQ